MNSVDRPVSRVCKAAVIVPALMLSVANLAYGQTGSAKEVIVANTPNVNVTNTPAVRINAENNTVRLTNTQADPLPVSVAGSAVRRPFHAGINVNIAAGGDLQRRQSADPCRETIGDRRRVGCSRFNRKGRVCSWIS